MSKRIYYDVKLYCSSCGVTFTIRMPEGVPLYHDGTLNSFYWFRSVKEEESNERTYIKCKQCGVEKPLFKSFKGE
ncbi:MAG TPA: hypothetical protein ENH06_00605 [bacterium]|nr:hypothetical protein [bacterium]